jgi:hypothetical protein
LAANFVRTEREIDPGRMIKTRRNIDTTSTVIMLGPVLVLLTATLSRIPCAPKDALSYSFIFVKFNPIAAVAAALHH